MKQVKYALKLTLPAKQATPRPPVSTALSPTNINIEKFCEDFNNWSKDLEGNIEIGVLIYKDLSYNILSKKEMLEYESAQFNESLKFLYDSQDEVTHKTR